MSKVIVMFYTLCFICAVFVGKISAGPFQALLYSDWITCDHNRLLKVDVSQVQVHFYDFKDNFNITYQIDSAVHGITTNHNLDFSRKLIFFVPGFKAHINKKTEELIRQTFRDDDDIYLIIIDHSAYTSEKGGQIESYERSVFYAYYIGTALGNLLAGFHAKGCPSNKIHALGHSLGSQMLGYAGTAYTIATNEKIWRITALDPAGPCFSNSVFEDQIRSGVAYYVEVYHCNSGGLGTTSVLADIDFFFNRGRKQPTCHEGIIPGFGESDAAKCSHKKCLEYWVKTVQESSWYLAWKCRSYEEFTEGECAGNEVTTAGYSNPGNATGVFYVSTVMFGVE